MPNLHPYYQLGMTLAAQERWLSKRLDTVKPQYTKQLTLWLAVWRTKVATSASIDDNHDHMANLRHSLDWYANLPWYHRFWLRHTTGVSLLSRYYTYQSILALISRWHRNNASATDPILYQDLQYAYRTTAQRYLATLSWDRLVLHWYFQRITSAWTVVMTCRRYHLTRNSAMKTQLRYLLTQTKHELNRSHWTLRLFFPSIAVRANKLNLDKADILTKAHAHIMLKLNQTNPSNWRGRLHEHSRDFQAYCRLVYYKLLEQSLHRCLEQLNAEDFPETEFIQSWEQFEKILIEGSFLAVNHHGQLASAAIWKIYVTLSLQLCELGSIQLDSTSSSWRTSVYNTCCRIKSIQADWLHQGAKWQSQAGNQQTLTSDNKTPSAAAEQSYDFSSSISGQAACHTLRLDPAQAFTWNDVRLAYKRLLMEVHPDKQATRPAEERLSEAEAVARSQAVTQAFRCLFDLKAETNSGQHTLDAWEQELRQFDQQFQDIALRFSMTAKQIVENRDRNTLRRRHLLDAALTQIQPNNQLDERLARLEAGLSNQVPPQVQEPDLDRSHDNLSSRSP